MADPLSGWPRAPGGGVLSGFGEAGFKGECVGRWAVAIETPQARKSFVDARPMSCWNPPKRLIGAFEAFEVLSASSHFRRVSASINELEQGVRIAPDGHVDDEERVGRRLNIGRISSVPLKTPHEPGRRIGQGIYSIERIEEGLDPGIVGGSNKTPDVDLCQFPASILHFGRH